MTTPKLLNLTKGEAVCKIAPELGGSIMALEFRGALVMRRATADHPLGAACFPLLPFANRIDHGRIIMDGVERQVAVGTLAAPHAIHGNGWHRAWEIEEASECHVALRLDEAADDWPWPYRAWQRFTLEEDGLLVEMTIQNRHESEAMPAGFGLHPYFPRRAESRIAATSSLMWFNDTTGLAQIQQESGLFHGASVAVEALEGLDNFFVAPDPQIVISGADASLTITAQGAGFHLYCPADEDFFCVEPVSHAPNSFGRDEWSEGDILAPGESRSQSYHFGFHV